MGEGYMLTRERMAGERMVGGCGYAPSFQGGKFTRATSGLERERERRVGFGWEWIRIRTKKRTPNRPELLARFWFHGARERERCGYSHA